MFRPALLIAALSFVALPAFAAGPVGDAAKGKTAYASCAACHAVVAGKNGVGPSLFGVVGRKAGTVEGFRYSAAMQAYGKTWTAAQLDAYLKAPKTEVPGNSMPFFGISDDQKRADIVAYLKTLH